MLKQEAWNGNFKVHMIYKAKFIKSVFQSYVLKLLTGLHRFLTSTLSSTFEVNGTASQALLADISAQPHECSCDDWVQIPAAKFQNDHGIRSQKSLNLKK